MYKENRELLLKDVCSRLPYGVIIKSLNGDDYGPVIDVCYPQGIVAYMGQKMDAYTEEFMPYLRPMSSMTEEEVLHIKLKYGFCYDNILSNVEIFEIGGYYDRDGNYSGPEKCKTIHHITIDKVLGLINYLNSHHLDYRGLIEKGLALEAPEGMYKTE